MSSRRAIRAPAKAHWPCRRGKRLGGRLLAGLLSCWLALLLHGFASVAAAQSGSTEPRRWTRYVDARAGVSLDLPAHLFALRSGAQEHGGVLFSTPDDRARLLVFGFINEAGETPRAHLDKIVDFREARFTYVRTTGRFFAVSGTRKGMIFYRRCNFSPRPPKRVACMHVEYPQGEKRAWDRAVTRMSRSLRIVAGD